jgi:hypothetical protein
MPELQEGEVFDSLSGLDVIEMSSLFPRIFNFLDRKELLISQ